MGSLWWMVILLTNMWRSREISDKKSGHICIKWRKIMWGKSYGNSSLSYGRLPCKLWMGSLWCMVILLTNMWRRREISHKKSGHTFIKRRKIMWWKSYGNCSLSYGSLPCKLCMGSLWCLDAMLENMQWRRKIPFKTSINPRIKWRQTLYRKRYRN